MTHCSLFSNVAKYYSIILRYSFGKLSFINVVWWKILYTQIVAQKSHVTCHGELVWSRLAHGKCIILILILGVPFNELCM